MSESTEDVKSIGDRDTEPFQRTWGYLIGRRKQLEGGHSSDVQMTSGRGRAKYEPSVEVITTFVLGSTLFSQPCLAVSVSSF